MFGDEPSLRITGMDYQVVFSPLIIWNTNMVVIGISVANFLPSVIEALTRMIGVYPQKHINLYGFCPN